MFNYAKVGNIWKHFINGFEWQSTNTYIKIFITLQRHIYPMIAKFEKLFSSQGMDTEKKKSYWAAIKEAKTKPLEEFEKYA